MKQLLIATAIAATVATGAQAQQKYEISSHITATQLWLGGTDLVALPTGFSNNLEFGGFAYDDGVNPLSSQVTFHGSATFDAGGGMGPVIRLTFELSKGGNTVGGPNPGVTFTGGEIQIDYFAGAGWLPYATVDAATTAIPFKANLTGHLGTNVTTGLILNPAAVTVSLPGLYDGTPATEDFAVSAISLFSTQAGLFMKGTFTMTPN
jgi:hypothetical protein